jgi:hypothetical protein
MTADRRGFDYALEPVRSLTAWSMNDLVQELAALNAAVHERQHAVDQSTQNVVAARADLLRQRQQQALLDIAAQRRAHAYLDHVQHRLTQETTELQSAHDQRDAVLTQLHRLRKFADGLDRDKAAVAVEHDQKIAREQFLQADESWMQRMHWRKSA